MSIIERIEALYLYRARRICESVDGAPFSVLEHALQAAQLAEEDESGSAMVTAAFLHDVGRLLPAPAGTQAIDDVHELRAGTFLAPAFARNVVEPVRLHVQAKRYLVARERAYLQRLSPASARALAANGGPMTPVEAAWFVTLPFAAEAVTLRLYDDRAWTPGRKTSALHHFLGIVEQQLEQHRRHVGESIEAMKSLPSFSVA